MPKGKKFTAAEKHFEKKCVEWRHKIKKLEQENQKLYEQNRHLVTENNNLVKEVKCLKEEVDQLMELCGLSQEEIKTLVESKRAIVNLNSLATTMCRFM